MRLRETLPLNAELRTPPYWMNVWMVLSLLCLTQKSAHSRASSSYAHPERPKVRHLVQSFTAVPQSSCAGAGERKEGAKGPPRLAPGTHLTSR